MKKASKDLRSQLEGSWKYVAGELTPAMISKTIESYDTHVIEYAESFEWDPDMQERTSHDYLHGFIEYLKTGDHVFVAGSGTGRDALELANRHFDVFCNDGSIAMLQVAVNHGIRLPMWCQDINHVNLPENSVDAILAESVLQHVPKQDIHLILNRMVTWLRVDGILFARLRLGDGRIFCVNDVVGERYFTSYKKQEIEELIQSLHQVYLVEDVRIVMHKVSDRPGFASFVLKKQEVKHL